MVDCDETRKEKSESVFASSGSEEMTSRTFGMPTTRTFGTPIAVHTDYPYFQATRSYDGPAVLSGTWTICTMNEVLKYLPIDYETDEYE